MSGTSAPGGGSRPADVESVLRMRAARLARPPPPPREAIAALEFRAGKDTYLLPASAVTAVLRTGQLTPLPGTSTTMLGIVYVRGEVVPVFDLATTLGLPPQAGTNGVHTIVVLGGGHSAAGLAVDAVLRIRTLARDGIGPAPDGAERGWVRGVTADGAGLLDSDRLLSDNGPFAPSATTTTEDDLS